MSRFCACLIDSLSRLRLMAWKIRAYGSARSKSNLSFWAQLGSSNFKLELLGSARLKQIKLWANLARLSSTINCWLDHPCNRDKPKSQQISINHQKTENLWLKEAYIRLLNHNFIAHLQQRSLHTHNTEHAYCTFCRLYSKVLCLLFKILPKGL